MCECIFRFRCVYIYGYIVAHMALASNCRMICEISRWSLSLQGGHWSFSILHTKSWHFTSLCFLATPSATGMSYFDQDKTPQYLVLPLFCLFIRSGWDSFCTPLLVPVLGLLSAQKNACLKLDACAVSSGCQSSHPLSSASFHRD